MICDVYFNIRRKVLSLRSRETRIVFGHRKAVIMTNCKFVVSQKGRERVLREKKKKVHAYVRGNFEAVGGDNDKQIGHLNQVQYVADQKKKEQWYDGKEFLLVTYNPYRDIGFCLADDHQKVVLEAEKVFIIDKEIYVKNPVFK